MKHLNINKISTKLFLTYVVACVVPILLLSAFLIAELASFSRRNTEMLTANENTQLMQGIMDKLESANSIINTMLQDKALIKYLCTDYTNDYEALSGYIEMLEKRILSLTNRQFSVIIFSENESIGISRATNNSLDDFYREYGSGASLQLGETHWQPVLNSPATRRMVGEYKVLVNYNSAKRPKLVFSVEIPADNLISVDSAAAEFTKLVYLLDPEDRIIASTEKSALFTDGNNLSFGRGKTLADMKTGEICELNGVQYYVYLNEFGEEFRSKYTAVPPWRMLYLVPYGYLQRNIEKIVISCLIILSLCLTLSFLLAKALSNNITSRLSMLAIKTKGVLGGNFNISAPVKIHDEIGDLESSLYEMVEYIDNMVHEIYMVNIKTMEQTIRQQSLEQEKRKSEIIALKSQINPHYLFNTLESIRMHLIASGDRQTANIIKLFADSFRVIIEDSGSTHTLERELEFVKNYLTIQQYRFSRNLKYEILCPEHLKSVPIPKLMIQPLVENSVVHGFERRKDGGTGFISVEISCNGGRLIVAVRDNGSGIPGDTVHSLNAALKDGQAGEGFSALGNIASRLRLQYGTDAYIRVESRPGAGTAAYIELPCPEAEEDSSCSREGE